MRNNIKNKIVITALSCMTMASVFMSNPVFAMDQAGSLASTLDEQIDAVAEGVSIEDLEQTELINAAIEDLVTELENVGSEYMVGDQVPSENVVDAVDAVYAKALELKESGYIESVAPRDSEVYVVFTNGSEYTWSAGNEAKAVEEDEPKVTLQPIEEAQEMSEEQKTRWSPSDPQNKVQQFMITVPTQTIRYEIFYTAGTEAPKVSFQSTTGAEGNLVSGNNVENGDFKFITKTGLTIEDHDDFRYMVIYISGTKDPGKWLMTVEAPQTVNEVICVSSKVPDDWDVQSTDTITRPYGVIFWYIDERRSVYAEQPVNTINMLMNATGKLGDIDEVKDTVVPEEDYSGVYVLLGGLVFIAVVTAGVFFVIKTRKKQQEQYRAKREAIVKRENEKVRKKKAQENDELDDLLDDYSDEYINDDDMSDYFNTDDSDPYNEFTEDEDNGVYKPDDDYETAKRVRDKLEESEEEAPWETASENYDDHGTESSSDDNLDGLEEVFGLNRSTEEKTEISKPAWEEAAPATEAVEGVIDDTVPVVIQNFVEENSVHVTNNIIRASVPAWMQTETEEINENETVFF
nr:hypothetical protein [uncultured Butyrivibrio sp.]